MKRGFGTGLFANLLLMTVGGSAYGWEATRPIGPLRPDEAREKLALGSVVSSPVSRRTIQYPYESGARLGDGWDFINNKRVYSQCIQFGTSVRDAYQQASLNYKQAFDQETLAIAMNVSASASASGSVGIFSGNASGSFSLDSSYRFTSQDEVLIANASVVNGSTYVTAQGAQATSHPTASVQPATEPNVAGVVLSAGALKLAKDPVAFRAACGDGFIASIATGADLYILYHFTHVDKQTSITISNSMKAGGGVGGLFSASGSLSSTLKFDDQITQNRLGIFFAQNGGKIAALPVVRADVEARVKGLAAEAFDNGRPIFMVVVPYTELSNWPQSLSSPKDLDYRTAAVRYFQRLTTAYFELQNVIADFEKPGALVGPPTNDSYLHDLRTALRAISYSDLNNQLLNEIDTVSKYIAAFDSHCPRGVLTKSCQAALKQIPPFDYDDFKFWIQLPLPYGAVSDSIRNSILDAGKDIEPRKFTYSMQLYLHWVERLAMARCSLFFECMTSDKRRLEYGRIAASLGMITPSMKATILGTPLTPDDYATVGYTTVGREAAEQYRQQCANDVGPKPPAKPDMCSARPSF